MLVRTIKNNLRKSILKRVLPNDFYFSIKGYCPCCEKEVLFEARRINQEFMEVLISQK